MTGNNTDTQKKVRSGNLHVYFLLCLTVLIWGNSFLAIKYLTGSIEPYGLTLARLTLSALLFLPWLLIKYKKESIRILKEDFLYVAFLGIFGISCYHLFINFGEDGDAITSGTAGLIIGLVPVFTTALAIIVKHEKFRWYWALGSIISIAGLLAIMFAGQAKEGQGNNLKNIIFVLLAAWVWALYTIMCRRLNRKKYPPVVVVGWAIIIGLVPLFFTVNYSTFIQSFVNATFLFWVALLFLAIFCTFLAYLIWNYSLTKLSASKVSSSVYFIPPASLFFGWIFLKEGVNIMLLIGAILIIGGVVITDLGKKEIVRKEFEY